MTLCVTEIQRRERQHCRLKTPTLVQGEASDTSKARTAHQKERGRMLCPVRVWATREKGDPEARLGNWD